MNARKPETAVAVSKAVRHSLMVVLGVSLVISLMMLAVPLYAIQSFDQILFGDARITLGFITTVTAASLAVLASLELLRGRILLKLAVWVDARLSSSFFTIAAQSTLRDSEARQMRWRDLETLRYFLASPGLTALVDLISIPVVLLFLFIIHPALGLTGSLALVSMLALTLVNARVTRPLLAAHQAAGEQATAAVQAAEQGAEAARAMGMTSDILLAAAENRSQSLAMYRLAAGRQLTLSSLSSFIKLLAPIAILAVGIQLVIYGQLMPGALVAAVYLIMRGLTPLDQTLAHATEISAARDAWHRLKLEIQNQPDALEAPDLPQPAGHLEAKALSLSYPNQPGFQLKEITFKLEAGTCLGVIGPSGSGKTTLMRALLGLTKPAAGQALLDNIPVAAYLGANSSTVFGYVPQDSQLFNGTVRENIARMHDGDPRDIVSAARMAECHELILHLPQGYETRIGPQGSQLPSGIRQRIALARAIYGQPRFIVFDEPNANLDGQGEQVLIRTIQRLKSQGVTIVLATHRQKLLRLTDKLLVLNKGQIKRFDDSEKILRTTESAEQLLQRSH
ncbi:MAG: type I secretion system permease/ATPase [Thiotrichales bacterium]